MKKMNKKLLLLIIGLSIIALIGMSYAYLASSIVGNEDDKLYVKTEQYGVIRVTYDTTYSEISINSLDLNNETSGQTLSNMMKFYLKNIGDKTSEINIKWDDITNNFCQYRNENYECVDPSGSEYYVGDELRASLYECDSSGYALTDIATIKSTCTKISASEDKALPLTGSTEKLNTSLISVAKNALKYYIVIVDIDNLTTNQNYQQEKSVTLGVQVEFNVKKIADAIYAEYTPLSDASIDFSKTSENPSQITNGLYINNKVNIANDPTQGKIKYFRGAVNNYVTFAGLTWRVVRINENGNVRIISEDNVVSQAAFNTTRNNAQYVGYTYGRTAESLGTASTIKTALDGWYTDNLSTYASYINQTAEYCNDASGTESDYGAATRLYTNDTPSFYCPAPISTYGGTYQLPIGTITADEVVYAGDVYETNNSSYYLNNGAGFWTMSPCGNNAGYAYEMGVSSAGRLTYIIVNNAQGGFRAVIELESDTTVTGSGTEADPWIVQ